MLQQLAFGLVVRHGRLPSAQHLPRNDANLARRWIIDIKGPGRELAETQRTAPEAAASKPATPPVVAMSMPPDPAPSEIRVELRRGATAISVTWPVTAATECAAWMLRRSDENKRGLVDRSLLPGASVSSIALEAGINSNLLFVWRRQPRNCGLMTLLTAKNCKLGRLKNWRLKE